MKYLVVIIPLLIACSNTNEGDLNFLMHRTESSFRDAWIQNQLNLELSELIENSGHVRRLVRNTVDSITILEEHLIELAGGYKEGYEGHRSFLNSSKLPDPVNLIRNNPYGITTDWINRLPNYLKNRGYKYGTIVMNPEDDPYFKSAPAEYKDRDFFDLAFNDRNLNQCLIVLSGVKSRILEVERNYYQDILREKLLEKDSLQ